MFCTSCGKQIPDDAAVCPACGAQIARPQPTPAGQKKFCRGCGTMLDASAQACPNCGMSFVSPPAYGAAPVAGGKDFLTALLLCIFLGIFGVHRFYTGSVGIGLGQLFTLGGCGIWALVDLIMIATGSYRDGNGQPLVRN